MSIIGWLILGLIAGFIASKIVNKTGEGLMMDIVLGVVGAIVGGYLFSLVGASPVTGLNIYSMFVAVIGAILVLVIYHAIAGRGRAVARSFVNRNKGIQMGLLDSVLGSLMGGAGSTSPMGGVLASLLGGGGMGMGQQSAGGLAGLMSSFQSAGLGQIAQSWVSNGPNQPVSPQQLQSVFGEQQVQGMATQAGMQPSDFLSQLSQHLPNAVNGMTPNGQLPEDGIISV